MQPGILYTRILEISNPIANIQILKFEPAGNFYINLRTYHERFGMTQLGVWVILFVINLVFFLSNRNNKSRLYFAVFALFYSIGVVIQLNLILENKVSNKFYAGNWVFVCYMVANFFLMTAIYEMLERKRDLIFWLIFGYILPALLLDTLVYGWGWQAGGMMLHLEFGGGVGEPFDKAGEGGEGLGRDGLGVG